MEDEPDWMNPANDRKTPYTEEEIEVFVDGFITGLEEHEWTAVKEKFGGESEARKRIRSGLISQDERNLVNLQPDEGIH